MGSAARFDVDRLLAIPRLSGLAVSPDGARLVTSVGTIAPDGKRYRSALWELDPTGEAAPRRLTHSERGDTLGAFLPDGSLLFLSARPDPDLVPEKRDGADEGPAALWLLPEGGGEPFQVASPAGGIEALAIAREAGTIACYVPMFPGSEGPDADKKKGDDRKDKGVSAQLFESYPIRFWDHYLGPRHRRVAVGTVTGSGVDRTVELRDLTPDAGPDLTECELDITPDGKTVVTTWRGKDYYAHLVAIDVATGAHRVLAGGDGTVNIHVPSCSPDGRSVAFFAETVGAPERPTRVTVRVADLASGEERDAWPGGQIWPAAVTWTDDASALIVSGDEKGRVPVWRIDLTGEAAGRITRLSDDGAFTDVRARQGRVFALRSTFDRAPHGAAFGDREPDQSARRLPSPGDSTCSGQRVEEMWVDAPDGRGRVHSFLFLPEDATPASPAPLVLFIHGGPFASYNGWQWRWNANVFADHGYAVLEVNPALSTGYGWENIDRSWSTWGAVVEADLMAAVDAACERPEIDGTRVAGAGGSFGGFMANWLAGHSARFRCLVTHASVWAMDQFHGTTDLGAWLDEEFGDPDTNLERWLANSPQQFLEAVAAHRTPMLVIHGELDHRVPISEALRLWTDLRRRGVPARFLYFPDENHWVLKPQNSRIWYRTVLAFLDEHLLGRPFERDDLL